METTLLIGADGAWLKMRPLVTGARPICSGICFLELHLDAGDPRAAATTAVTGSGTPMAVAPGQGILAHHNADGSIHIMWRSTGPSKAGRRPAGRAPPFGSIVRRLGTIAA